MRRKLVVSVAAATVAAGTVLASPASAVCAPGTTQGQGTEPVETAIPLGPVTIYFWTSEETGPRVLWFEIEQLPRHGYAGATADGDYVELFGARPTRQGHVHGYIAGGAVDYDVAIGNESVDVCINGTEHSTPVPET